jgi:hypothetical protein
VQGLHALAAECGLSDHVAFLGFVSGEEKRQVLREAWAFALPSHQENFGVAVLEAIAAGLPVVLSAEVQLRAFVEAKDLGVIVDRTDPGSIAEGLRAVLDDAARRKRVAEQGPAAVQETFSLERVGEQVRSLYEQALAAARSHPCCFRLQFCAAHRSAYALAHRAGAVPSAGMALVRVAVPLWVEERSPSIPHASSPIGAYFQRRRSGVCAGWSFARYLKRYTPICHLLPDTSL